MDSQLRYNPSLNKLIISHLSADSVTALNVESGFEMQVGTDLTTGGNVGVGTNNATGTNALLNNTKTLASGVVKCNDLFVSGSNITSVGFTVAFRNGAHTLTKSNTSTNDVGKLLIVGGSGDITVPQGVFSAGDVITILASVEKTIKQGTGSGTAPVLTFAGSSVTGDRSLAENGICTIICQYSSAPSGDKFIISGSGLS